MRTEQKMIIEKILQDLILLANQVDEEVGQAKLFRENCREMRKQVYQLSQMVKTLHCYVAGNPVLLYLNPFCCVFVISKVSRILEEALSLACKCQRKAIFCPLFTGTQRTSFHKLYHLLDACMTHISRLLIIYNPDFDSVVCNEIFLSLPQLIFTNGLHLPSPWSCMVTERTVNCRTIKELEKLMLCLTKLVKAEHGKLHLQHCLMTLMEITAAAESNNDLRCKAFKTNSPGAKATVELLLKVIKESEDYTLKVLAIISIGFLARIFRERENYQVISVLVSQLENEHQEVVREALVALLNFASDYNHLCKEHSNRMIEFNAAQLLVKLLRDGERELQVQLHGLRLMCCIAKCADYSAAMEQAMVVTAIRQLLTKEGGLRTFVSQHPEFKELATTALNCLALYYKY